MDVQRVEVARRPLGLEDLGRDGVTARPADVRDGVGHTLLSLAGRVARKHEEDGGVNRLENLHGVEGDDEAALGLAARRHGQEDDCAENVRDREGNHGVQRLVGLRDDPRDEQVQEDGHDAHGDVEELALANGEAECLVEEERGKRVDTTDDESLEERNEEEEEGVGVGQGLAQLFLLEHLVLEAWC